MSGYPGAEEPDFEDCHCAPFLPLARVWLPHNTATLQRCSVCNHRRRACACTFATEPPF
ncbi:hypothetical protein [Streptomyces sp. ISL-11]|uniref:hypothetical protein n=1 Tax=Streptomyces sp. ISL-11 TaxID=2819174 RepID=UPI001BE55C47|nr:hypothetical protein [Streptomyces sp. ISL-11]MBT2382099.1 hypothetical protein [Streptomyces sp. ISL-11]